MWDAQLEAMDGGRVRQVRTLCDGKPVSYGEIVERCRPDDFLNPNVRFQG